MSHISALHTTTKFEQLRTLHAAHVVRSLMGSFLLLVFGSQVPLQGQVSPQCSIEGPVAGQKQIVGTTGPDAVKVKVTVSDPDPKKGVYEVSTLLVKDKRFRVPTPALEAGQIIEVQEIKENNTNAEKCNATVAPAEEIEFFKTLLPPRRVQDMFGTRIAKGYIVIQVTVVNNSKQFDLVIHDISIDYNDFLGEECIAAGPGKVAYLCEASSQDLILLRGPAEIGRAQSPRNRTLRIMKGLGTAAVSVGTFVAVGPAFVPAVAAFSGPGISAYETVFPDFSIGQLNRLNDIAYAANTVVSKEQAKVLAVFVPQELLLSKAEKKMFWNNPSALFGHEHDPKDKYGDLKALKVIVDAKYVVTLDEVPPIITDIVIEQAQMQNFLFLNGKQVEGYVLGRFLTGGSVAIAQSESLGLEVAVNKAVESTDNRLYFTITLSRSVPPNETLTFQVLRQKQTSTFNKTLTHRVPAPTPDSLKKSDGSDAKGTPGEKL